MISDTIPKKPIDTMSVRNTDQQFLSILLSI